MANRYWVGGNGNWSDTSHWSTSSGGSSGASSPAITDDAIFDNNSFTGDCIVSVTSASNFNGYGAGWAGCASLYTNTISGVRKLTIQNSGGTAFVIPGYLNLAKTHIRGMNTIISNAHYGISNHTITCDTTSGSVAGPLWSEAESSIESLQINDNCTVTLGSPWAFGAVLLNPGTLTTNNYDFHVGNQLICYANTNYLNLGSSNAYLWYVNYNGYTLNVNAGTSTVYVQSPYNFALSFNGGSKTWYNVVMKWYGLGLGSFGVFGNNTFNNLTIINTDIRADSNISFPAGGTQIVNGTFIMPNTSMGNTILVADDYETQTTIQKSSGTVDVYNAEFWSMRGTGGATFNAINSENVYNNTGWNFKGFPPKGLPINFF